MKLPNKLFITILLSIAICVENVLGLCSRNSFLKNSDAGQGCDISRNGRSCQRQVYRESCASLEDAEDSNFQAHGLYEFVALSTKSQIVELPQSLQTVEVVIIENTILEQLTLSPQNFVHLQEIHLSRNKIRQVPEEMFSGMQNLNVLDLSYNNIEHIDENAFNWNKRLKCLYINNNNIKQISMFVFTDLQFLETLDLSNNPITHFSLSSTGNGNIPNQFIHDDLNPPFNPYPPPELSPPDQNQFFGDWFTSSDPSHFRYRRMLSPSSKFVPPENLKTLNMTNVNLDSTNYGLILLKFGTKLSELNLGENMITKINSVVFSDFGMLKTLNLSHNLIDSIDQGSFHNSMDLEWIFLNNNNIKNLTSSWFHPFRILKHLDLSHNPIHYIDHAFIANAVLLSMVNTSLIDENVVLVLGLKAQTVNISHNNISKIELTSSTIKSLDISFNNIISFLNSGYNFLENLSLRNNKLADLTENSLLLNKDQLQVIDISNNPIKKFSSSFLDNIENLEELYLESLQINDNSLKFNVKIKETITKISLKSNYLEKINSELFSNCTSLFSIDISNNVITNIDRDAFLQLYNLKELKIQNNSLKDIHSVLFRDTRSLTHLDLSNNNIEILPIGTFENCQNLKMLNLSFNHLQKLNEYNLYPLQNLQELYLQNNRLNNIDGIEYLKNIKIISLKNNPWKCKNLKNIFYNLNFIKLSSSLGLFDVYKPSLSNNIDGDSNLPVSHHIHHIACDSEQVDVSADETQTQHQAFPDLTNFKTQVNDLLKDIDDNFKQMLNELKSAHIPVHGNYTEFKNLNDNKSLVDISNFNTLFENINGNFEKVLSEMQKQQQSTLDSNQMALKNYTNVLSSNLSSNQNIDLTNFTNQMNNLLKNIDANFKDILSKMENQQSSVYSNQMALENYTNTLSSSLNRDINQINYTLEKMLQEIVKNPHQFSNAHGTYLRSTQNESAVHSGESLMPTVYVNMVLGFGIFCILCISLYLKINKKKISNIQEEHQLIETRM